MSLSKLNKAAGLYAKKMSAADIAKAKAKEDMESPSDEAMESPQEQEQEKAIGIEKHPSKFKKFAKKK